MTQSGFGRITETYRITGQTFSKFQKANNGTIVLQLKTSINLLVSTVTVEFQPFKSSTSGCDRNVAFSPLAWFLTLCSRSQRQTVLIYVFI